MAFSVSQQYFIEMLRSFFSMRTQAAAGSSFKLGPTLGDVELWEDLRLGLNFFNSYPPIFTTYTFKDLYSVNVQAATQGIDIIAPENEDSLSIFMTAILMCAMFFVGIRLQWFEAGKHFRFSDNGLSFERVKQADYQNVFTANISQFISITLPLLRKALAFSRVNIKGQFSGIVAFPRSLTKSLRGTRLGAG